MSDHKRRATVSQSSSSSSLSSTSCRPCSSAPDSSSSEATGNEPAGVSALALPSLSSLIFSPPSRSSAATATVVAASLLLVPLFLKRSGDAGSTAMLIPRPLSTLWIGESTDWGLANLSVFSSSASGEKSGLPLQLSSATKVGLEVSESRETLPPILLRVGVHGAKTGIGTVELTGDGDDPGGGEDVRKMSATAAMTGAAVLAPFLVGEVSRRGCVTVAEGRLNTGSMGEDGAAGSVVASPRARDLRRWARLRSSTLACSRASSASLRASASADMRGLVAVDVRAHSGTTYGALDLDGAGRDSGAALDMAAVIDSSEDEGTR